MGNLRDLKRHFQGRVDNVPLAVVIGLGVLSAATLIPVIGALVAFSFTGNLIISPAGLGDWGAYASFLTSMFQVIIGITTVAAALVATFILSRQIEERKEKDEQNMMAIRLSEMMYDKDFYVSVAAPSWEVATKWLRWQGDAGDAYRLQVISEVIDLSPRDEFHTPEEANNRGYHNLTRFVDHFTPYDRGGEVFTELSEHMALTSWFRFWCHVDFLLERGLVPEDAIQELFGGWYRNWYPFMFEYRIAATKIAAKLTKPRKKFLDQLERLEDRLKLEPLQSEQAHVLRGGAIADAAYSRWDTLQRAKENAQAPT